MSLPIHFLTTALSQNVTNYSPAAAFATYKDYTFPLFEVVKKATIHKLSTFYIYN